METNEIVQKLTTIFREIFSDPLLELKDDMTASDVSNWDSLTHMLMILEIEELFLIKFKLKDLNRVKSVGDIIALIESKLI